MEVDGASPAVTRVKANFRLGSEEYSVGTTEGAKLSDVLVSMKEESMAILKEFITKHNVPNDVPDELVESSSDEDDELLETPESISKKSKLV